jgi:flagellar motor switch protein FliG
MPPLPAARTLRQKDQNEMAPIPGPVKAAILLLALGEENGTQIWDMLDLDEVKRVSSIMAHLGSVKTEILNDISGNFLEEMNSSTLSGDTAVTEKILMNALPRNKAKAILQELRVPDDPTLWQKLSFINPEIVAKYLRNEYPQIAAAILVRFDPEFAAKILAQFPTDLATDLINRIIKIEKTDDAALKIIEDVLLQEFALGEKLSQNTDQIERISKIFNHLDKKSETRILTSLDDLNSQMSQKLRALLFSFDDLTKMSVSSAQVLIRSIDREVLIKALKGSTKTTREFFFSQMSQRAAKALQDEIEILGPIRLKEVDDSQRIIVNLAKDLAAKGEIVLASNSSDDEMV